jgi:hypothetical protein
LPPGSQSALRRHGSDRAFDKLQQRLLNAFTRNIPRNRRVIGLAGYLVDLVDIDDTRLRLLDVVLAILEQLLNDVFDVLADVTGFGQRRRVSNRERNVEQASERFGQQRLTAAGRADQ